MISKLLISLLLLLLYSSTIVAQQWDPLGNFLTQPAGLDPSITLKNNTAYVVFGWESPITKTKILFCGANSCDTLGNASIPLVKEGDACFKLDPAGIPYVAYYTLFDTTIKILKYVDNNWKLKTSEFVEYYVGNMSLIFTQMDFLFTIPMIY